MIHGRGRRKALLSLAALIAVGILGWRVPLFHVVRLERLHIQQRSAAFDAAKLAAQLWEAKLLPATNRAIEAKDLLSALAKDPVGARRQLGRSIGVGSTTFFLVKGTGRVKRVEEDAVVVVLDGTDATVSLATGLVFGNAVRDSTGVVDGSAYPSSQDFNDLSTQLDGLVETRVIPALREKAVAGKAIQFAGCAELDDEAKPEIFPVIALKVEWP